MQIKWTNCPGKLWNKPVFLQVELHHNFGLLNLKSDKSGMLNQGFTEAGVPFIECNFSTSNISTQISFLKNCAWIYFEKIIHNILFF